MATMMDNTMAAARNLFDAAKVTATEATISAKDAVGTAKERTEHVATSARSKFFDGIHALTGLAAMVKSFSADDALGRVGLARRRNPLVSLGIFGAGFAVGAGAGLFFAPTSGAELRSNLLKGWNGFTGDAKEAIQRAETEVESTVQEAKSIITGVADDVASNEKTAEGNKNPRSQARPAHNHRHS